MRAASSGSYMMPMGTSTVAKVLSILVTASVSSAGSGMQSFAKASRTNLEAGL